MNKYLILYDYGNYVIFDAYSINDCMIQLAEYTGDDTELFMKAINGVSEIEACIEMYNHFSTYVVHAVYQIEKEIYSDKIKI